MCVGVGVVEGVVVDEEEEKEGVVVVVLVVVEGVGMEGVDEGE